MPWFQGYEVVLESVKQEYKHAAVFAVRLATNCSLVECLRIVESASCVVLRIAELSKATAAKELLERSFKPPGWGKSGDPMEFDYRMPPEGETCCVVTIRYAIIEDAPKPHRGKLDLRPWTGASDPMEDEDDE